MLGHAQRCCIAACCLKPPPSAQSSVLFGFGCQTPTRYRKQCAVPSTCGTIHCGPAFVVGFSPQARMQLYFAALWVSAFHPRTYIIPISSHITIYCHILSHHIDIITTSHHVNHFTWTPARHAQILGCQGALTSMLCQRLHCL